MPAPDSTVLFWTLPTYTLYVAAGILVAAFITIGVYRWRYVTPVAALVDTLLAGLIGGVIVARASHILLHWAYFQSHTDEITDLQAGGLNWHGAVIGTLLVVVVVARIRDVRIPILLDGLALALPLIGLMVWWGCGAAHCSYGAEVAVMADYPAFAVWEEAGRFNLVAPRFATQRLGMLLSAGTLALAVLFTWRGWFQDRRFWYILAAYATGMMLVDSLRGDYALELGGQRLDVWLDAALALGSVQWSVYRLRWAR
jgi:prolipoprotein diacylglyceryltransferase